MIKTVITRENPEEEGGEIREEKEEEDFPKVFIGEVQDLQNTPSSLGKQLRRHAAGGSKHSC